MLSAAVRFVGHSTLNLLADTGSLWRLAVASSARFARGLARRERVRLRATILQAVSAGYGSVPLVTLICFLVGMIMALQSAYQLRDLGAVDLVPSLVAISITRELAPLLAAIIVAGRYGSAIAAELGTMKVSQEIDALTVMGIDPVSFLVVPRLAALILSLPCLTVFADVIGIVGGLAISVGALGIGSSRYVSLTVDALVLQDIFTGLVKALAFAGIIGLIGCHQGMQTRGGAEEVGRSTTAAVVRSIVLIIGADLFVTTLFYLRG
jgi:phospholipid/cholesterol/gamma-HCH transport system permease protein